MSQSQKKATTKTVVKKSPAKLATYDEEKADEPSNYYTSTTTFYTSIRSRINGELALLTILTVATIVLIILFCVAWGRIKSEIQTQDQVLYVCSSLDVNAIKSMEIPRVTGDKNPQDHKMRFNFVVFDTLSAWSKSGSTYEIEKNDQYSLILHLTLKFRSPRDKVTVRIMAEGFSDTVTSTNQMNWDSDAMKGYVSLHTSIYSSERIASSGFIVDTVEAYHDVAIAYNSVIPIDAKVFVSVTQSEDSNAQIFNTEDCGSNYFMIQQWS
jgi:hypothetical protein